jgi:hypothetical protein
MTQISLIQSTLQQELNNVPQKIKDWFGSEKITNSIIDLNQNIGIDELEERGRIIPKLLLRLEVKDLLPQNFTQELSNQLEANYEIAKGISREIKKQILEPISHNLLNWGVDINFIAIGGLNITEIKPITKPEPELEANPIEPISFAAPAQPPAELPIASEIKSFNTTQDKPFILHQETELKPVAEKKRVSFPAIGWFKKSVPSKIETPVKVELEMFDTAPASVETTAGKQGKEPVIAKTELPKQKVIHYKEAGTSNPFGKPAETPTPVKPPEPQPSPEATAGEAKVINLDSFE